MKPIRLSGVKLASLCKRAAQNMFGRCFNHETNQLENEKLRKAQVSEADFNDALNGMRPMFAPNDDELACHYANGGVVFFNEEVEEICSRLRTCADQLRSSNRTRILPVLLHGKAKSGKTPKTKKHAETLRALRASQKTAPSSASW